MLETIKKEEFESITKLSNLSLKISEAKETLEKLEQTETEYIQKREKNVQAKIQEVLEESKDLIEQTIQNHQEIQTFANVVMSYIETLDEVQGKFEKVLEDFNKRNEVWDKMFESQQETLSNYRYELKQERENLTSKEHSLKELEKSG